MAAFPLSLLKGYALQGTSEQPQPLVLRSEMERGVPQQRRISSDALVTVQLTLVFDSAANATAFEDWFYLSTGAGAGANWFDWVHPRTGATVQARVIGGELGALAPDDNTWQGSTRSLRLEYLRPAYA